METNYLIQSMVILGVVMTEHIGFEMHIKRIMCPS